MADQFNFLQIKETCLYVKDLESTKNFYTAILGLPLISYKENSHAIFRAGTSMLLCFNAEETKIQTEIPPHFGSGNIHLAFALKLQEHDGLKQHLLKKNIQIEQEHQWPNGKMSFYFRDPDNHLLEVVEPELWD